MEKPFVLVADDNEATCTLITALLQHEFSVDVATDGAEALEKLKSRQYAVIMLDLLMPMVDGYAVLDTVRIHYPELLRRTLIVTAALSSRAMERVRQYDVCGVVAKPFEVDALLAAVRQCAGEVSGPHVRGPFLSSGVILLLGELLRSKWVP